MAESEPTAGPWDDLVEARRRFLASCGRYAAVTPPEITSMLAGFDHAEFAGGNDRDSCE
jgi:hypothetical protein